LENLRTQALFGSYRKLSPRGYASDISALNKNSSPYHRN
jgi:hypothetical protein